MDAQYFTLLEKALQNEYVPHLPPLLDTKKPPEEQAKKNISRAFSAFVLSDLCGISPSEAGNAVVDDFDDNGIDAAYYFAQAETLYLIQGKIKATATFDREDALKFCQGVKMLVRQEFDSFNAHVKNRQTELEGAIENCSHIVLVVAHIGSGISKHADDDLRAFLKEKDAEDDRLQDTYESFDSVRTIEALRVSKAFQKVNADLNLQKCKSISEPRETYFGMVNLLDLVQLHKIGSSAQ